MGTTLALMIGILAPNADPTLPATYKVYGDAQVTTAGFTTPTARQRQKWTHAAERQFSVLPASYARQDIPLPSRPGNPDGEDLSSDSIVDDLYHAPSCDCNDCTASVGDCCDQKSGGCSCNGRLPNAWRARCNLPQHHPYVAEPKTYYYFRAYTHIHTSAIQEEALLHGASRTNPYDTNLFTDVYEEIAKQLKTPAEGAKTKEPADDK